MAIKKKPKKQYRPLKNTNLTPYLMGGKEVEEATRKFYELLNLIGVGERFDYIDINVGLDGILFPLIHLEKE